MPNITALPGAPTTLPQPVPDWPTKPSSTTSRKPPKPGKDA